MGFKGRENLTSAGYKNKHKQKKSIQTSVDQYNKRYKQYKRMYDKLTQKYFSDQDRNNLSIIMGRSSLSARVSPRQNRELALLDTDKQLSLLLGTLKMDDIRFKVMRQVLQSTLHSRMQRSDRQLLNNVIQWDEFFGREVETRQRRERIERIVEADRLERLEQQLARRRREEQRQTTRANEENLFNIFVGIRRQQGRAEQTNIFNRNLINNQNARIQTRTNTARTGMYGQTTNIFERQRVQRQRVQRQRVQRQRVQRQRVQRQRIEVTRNNILQNPEPNLERVNPFLPRENIFITLQNREEPQNPEQQPRFFRNPFNNPDQDRGNIFNPDNRPRVRGTNIFNNPDGTHADNIFTRATNILINREINNPEMQNERNESVLETRAAFYFRREAVVDEILRTTITDLRENQARNQIENEPLPTEVVPTNPEQNNASERPFELILTDSEGEGPEANA